MVNGSFSMCLCISGLTLVHNGVVAILTEGMGLSSLCVLSRLDWER